MSLAKDKFADENPSLFLNVGAKAGSASCSYSEELRKKIIQPHINEVSNHMMESRFHAHGIRKGSGSFAASGTTAPPSLTSIARRGEWSIGIIFDIYLHFCATQDHYLGRILAGLDPNSVGFDILPPHFTVRNPMDDMDSPIRRGMVVTYGKRLLEQHRNFVPILLRCFASIVYHSDNLILMRDGVRGHEFAKLAILIDRPLLNELKQLVTTNPTDGVLEVATGIPPHVSHAKLLRCVIDSLSDLQNIVQSQSTTIIESLNNFLEDKAAGNGQVTGERLA